MSLTTHMSKTHVQRTSLHVKHPLDVLWTFSRRLLTMCVVRSIYLIEKYYF